MAAAALNYFNKSLDELTLEESALLAAMPKAPANYDPRKNYDGAKQRRDWVLTRIPSPARRPTLIAKKEAGSAPRYVLDIRLQGENETVFFDI